MTLFLVGWVFAICFMQNSSLFSVCSFKQSAFEPASVASITANADHKQDELTEPCDLTEKLLNSAKLNLEHLMVFSFVFALSILTWLGLTRPQAPSFTEPIVPKARVHLRLCVFRE